MSYIEHTFSDGSTIGGEPQYVAQAIRIRRSMYEKQRQWIANLRARGVKAAHPDDGWVNCDRNAVHLMYPQFNDGLEVGDLLALGSSYWGSTRIVRVIGTDPGGPLVAPCLRPGEPWQYLFEEI